jgi:hypothetical protein
MRQVTAMVWDRDLRKRELVSGVFHQWGYAYEEFQSGPGNYTVGIVELPNGKIVTPLAEDIQFCDKGEER